MAVGTLIIAGGAITAHAAEIFQAFVHAAGGPGKLFAVLPSGSSVPNEAFAVVEGLLVACGVPAVSVHLLRASCRVPGWEGGSEDPALVSLLETCDGIWIAGGNQNEIMRCLVRADGSDTRLLAALRRRFAAGAVLGGTSAGAAVMSNPMIGGGTSFGALCLPRATGTGQTEISDALLVCPGLGFFPVGIVDQHFDTRARLGRLMEAALVEDGAARLAFGVAEDSAMVWNASSSSISALGTGGVYVVDVRKARRRVINGQSRIQGAALHYLCEGDSYNLESGGFLFKDKQLVSPAEALYTVPLPESSGVFSGYGQLHGFISNFLLDNRVDCLFREPEPEAADETGYARSYLIGMKDGSRLAWELRFHRDPLRTQGWTGKGFSFRDVVVDVLPLHLSIEEFLD